MWCGTPGRLTDPVSGEEESGKTGRDEGAAGLRDKGCRLSAWLPEEGKTGELA